MQENKEVETITNEEQQLQAQPTVQSVESNNNDKKGNNKKLITIILIIAAGLCVVFAVVFFVFFNHSDKDDDYDNELDVVEKEDEDKKETTDDETKKEEKTEENKQNEVCEPKGKDKSDEVEKILGKANLGSTYGRVLYNNNKYEYSQISDGAKFQTTIWSYDGKKVKKKYCFDEEQKNCDMDDVYDFEQIKKDYKDMFGIDYNLNINGHEDIKFNEIESRQFIAGACPFVDKIDGNDIYLANRCGGTSGNGVYADYVYDYKKSDSTVEVYVAVAYWAYGTSQSTETIYKDYEFKNAYKTDVTFKDCIKIDKDNYDSFSKFKIVYEKNSSGKYIFKSSERISSGK